MCTKSMEILCVFSNTEMNNKYVIFFLKYSPSRPLYLYYCELPLVSTKLKQFFSYGVKLINFQQEAIKIFPSLCLVCTESAAFAQFYVLQKPVDQKVTGLA